MNMIKYKNIYCTYFKQGFTTNGNMIYVFNFFKEIESRFMQINNQVSIKCNLRVDKKGNIKSGNNGNIDYTIIGIIEEYLK